jgi:hypothetical protein
VTPNQKLVDRLIRHRVYLLGFAKHISARIATYLDSTEPEMRTALLDIFGPQAGESRLIARLRDAEARLFGIRSRVWNKSYHELVALLLDAVSDEPRVLGIKTKFDQGVAQNKVSKALIAGQTLKNWWQQLKDADIRRILSQLRVSVLGGEGLPQLLKRLTGKLSAVAAAAKNGISAIVNTAVVAATGAMRRLAVEANSVMFDWELWVSILDSKTTITCRDLACQMFPLGEGPQPGYHLNCRSERIPVSDGGGEYNLGSYKDWANLQPLSFRRYAGTDDFNVKKLKPLAWADVREREERDEL